MDLFDAFLLGAIQGITEWLPISSSGHLVIAEELLKLKPSENLLFDLVVHLGTLLAVCAYFYKELARIVVSIFTRKAERDPQKEALRTLGFLLLIGTIPAAIMGVLLSNEIEKIFDLKLVGIALVVNGLMLFAYERYGSKGTRKNAKLVDALVIGAFQAVAIIPGISRSGSTIGGGMMRGLEREIAAVFAFLLSVPTLAGAFVYGFLTLDSYDIDPSAALMGLFIAFITGLVSIQYLLKAVRSGKLWVFSIYCAIVGMSVLVFAL